MSNSAEKAFTYRNLPSHTKNLDSPRLISPWLGVICTSRDTAEEKYRYLKKSETIWKIHNKDAQQHEILNISRKTPEPESDATIRMCNSMCASDVCHFSVTREKNCVS